MEFIPKRRKPSHANAICAFQKCQLAAAPILPTICRGTTLAKSGLILQQGRRDARIRGRLARPAAHV
jgi:hypothetical protein